MRRTLRKAKLALPDVFCIDSGKTHVDAVRSFTDVPGRSCKESAVWLRGRSPQDSQDLSGTEVPSEKSWCVCTFLTIFQGEVHHARSGLSDAAEKGNAGIPLGEGKFQELEKKRRELLMRHYGLQQI